MNIDGSAAVAADLSVGATLPVLGRHAPGAARFGSALHAAGAEVASAARARLAWTDQSWRHPDGLRSLTVGTNDPVRSARRALK